VNTWIAAYFGWGACFGLATFSRKHLFSEGPERPLDAAQRGLADSRLVWALICSGLWPLMLLTGILSYWRLHKRRSE
jgi:hypothetical protein